MYDNRVVNEVKYLKENGNSCIEISDIMRISKASVWWILNKRKKLNNLKPGPKCKINKRLSIRIKRCVAKMNSEGRKVTCVQIKNELKLDIERRTINNWFMKHGYKYKSHAQKCILSKQHKARRVQLVSQWLTEKIEWNQCIFTDEKCWSIDGPDNW